MYTLTARSDDYPADKTTTAAVSVDATKQYYESFQNYLRTKTDNTSSATDDVDWIRVALRENVPYRFVYDVACRHEGIIEGVYTSAGILVANSGASINRRTDGWCTDLTMPFTPTSDGEYFVAVTARGSHFPEVDRSPFLGVHGTLTVVDTTADTTALPRIVSRQVTSRPVAPTWYGPGEQIQFTVGFSLPVTVVGDPQLEFNVTTPGPQNEYASYLSGSGTRELVFSYTVGTGDDGDDDDDGIYWSSNSLRLDSDDAITGVHNGLDAVLDHTALNRLDRHRIDQNPRVVSQEVTSDPTRGANSDTYGAGDAITFEVVFNQSVTVTGGPRLRFNIGSGSGDEYASYVSGSGTDTLVFSYTVLAADADGFYRYNNPLDYPDTATDSIVGTANNLAAENEVIGRPGAVSGHKVDGTITN